MTRCAFLALSNARGVLLRFKEREAPGQDDDCWNGRDNLSFFLLLPREEALLTVDDLGAELTARQGELIRLALGRDGWCVQMINVNQ
jgi:hypothetical protein